jgi:hypothetical protein
MEPKLLTRDQFREGVFARDGHKCVFCGKKAEDTPEGKLDAHHIVERRLWSDGGYYLENGATVCEKHHLDCERTVIPLENVRHYAGITKIIVPDQFYPEQPIDKWGNYILENGRRTRGELFFDESVQKVLRDGGVLDLFTPYVKYGRTWHLPWSPGAHDDDKTLNDASQFYGKRVIITKKMDGENCVRGDVLIDTVEGPLTIAEIVDGKKQVDVLTFNEASGEIEPHAIEAWNVVSETDEWYEIETVDGRTVQLTAEHRVFLPSLGVYRRVRDLQEGDEVLVTDK